MTLELRRTTGDECDAFVASAAIPFFEADDELERAQWRRHWEPDRAWVVTDRGRFVANGCTLTRDVAVPGPEGGPCPTVPMAAVSAIGVHPTHRRQGLLRRMMAAMLDDARRRGEPVAGLQASESSIYGRFGYGPATSAVELVIDPARAALRAGAAAPAIPLELMNGDEAAKVLPALHDRLRRRRPGEVNRNPATWADRLADRPERRGGASPRYWAVGEDGFVSYRVSDRSEGELIRAEASVEDLYGASPAAEAALWRFVFDLDLVTSVRMERRPVDDPFRWRLLEPRQLRTVSLFDQLWIRVVDVAAALSARSYGREGRLVLEVVAADDPEVAGRWVLEADGPAGGASCRRAPAGEGVDLTLGIEELGAAYLGGVAPSLLAAAGRVREERRGALAGADALFTTRVAPFTATLF